MSYTRPNELQKPTDNILTPLFQGSDLLQNEHEVREYKSLASQLDEDNLIENQHDTTHEKLLTDHLMSLIIAKSESEAINVTKIIKYLVKGSFLLTVGLAALPVIEAPKKFAGDNQVLAGLYIYSFFTSIGVLNIWGALDYYQHAKATQIVESSRLTILRRSLTSVVSATIAAIPGGFLSYHYNQNIPLTIQGVLCDISLWSCSFQRIQNEKIVFLANQHNQLIYKVMMTLVEEIEEALQLIINSNTLSRAEFLAHTKALRSSIFLPAETDNNLLHLKEVLRYLLRFSNSHLAAIEKNSFWLKGMPYLITKYASPVLALPWGIIYLISGRGSVMELTDSGIFSTIAIIPGSIATYFIETILTGKILLRLYSSLVAYLNNTHLAPFSYQFYPKAYVLLELLGLFTAAFAFAGRAQFISDFIPDPYRQILTPYEAVMTDLFKCAAITSLIEDLFLEMGRRSQREEVNLIAHFALAIKQFKLSVKIASFSQITQFLEHIEIENIATEIVDETALSKQIKLFQASTQEQRVAESSLNYQSIGSYNPRIFQIHKPELGETQEENAHDEQAPLNGNTRRGCFNRIMSSCAIS
jgi:hypothetical protein